MCKHSDLIEKKIGQTTGEYNLHLRCYWEFIKLFWGWWREH